MTMDEIAELPYDGIETAEDESDWVIHASVPPTDTVNVIKFTYTAEMGLVQKTVYCMVVWENNKTGQYRLIAPWIDKFVTIQKANLQDTNPELVPKSEMK